MRNVYSRKCTTSSGEKQKPRPVVSGMMMVGEGDTTLFVTSLHQSDTKQMMGGNVL